MNLLNIVNLINAGKRNRKSERQKFQEKQLKKGQYTFCYCECGNELISNKCCIRDTDYVYFKCNKCGKISKWDFDAPCPILIESDVK